MRSQKLSAMCLAVLFMLVEGASFENSCAANAQSNPQSDSRTLISHVGVRGSGSNRARAGRRGRHKKHRGHHKGRHKHRNNGGQNWSNQGSNPGGWQGMGDMHHNGSSNWSQLEGAGNGKGKHGRHKRHHGRHKKHSMQMPGNPGGSTNPAGGQFGQ